MVRRWLSPAGLEPHARQALTTVGLPDCAHFGPPKLLRMLLTLNQQSPTPPPV